MITRALGTARRVKADLFQETVAEGDYLLLCSDGLINEVTDQEIHREVLAGGPPGDLSAADDPHLGQRSAGQRHRCAVPTVRRRILP
ncbi:MAG: hypothetical protein ACLR1T_03545 [Evtepia gabavorous]